MPHTDIRQSTVTLRRGPSAKQILESERVERYLAERLQRNLTKQLDSLYVVTIDGQIDCDAVESQSNGFAEDFADRIRIAETEMVFEINEH